MACFHPIEAWNITDDQLDLFGKIELSFREPFDRDKMIRQGRRLLLPCRKCIGCRLDRSREWANRVVMEQIYHDESWFLTLTYDDEHLPTSYAKSALGNNIAVHSTLVKSDLQKFIKRLRFNSGQSIRYYAAGEYGTHTYRPHYHLLIFGLHLDDLQLIRRNFAGNQYYISDFISKCWPYGIHILGQVTWQSAAYVARYTMKKAVSGYKKSNFVAAGIQPEFQVMSLRPAIGRRYYDDHPEIFDYDMFSVSTPQGGRKMYPPEYFRKLHNASVSSLDHINSVFDSSLDKELRIHLKLLLTDKSYYDILKDDERRLLSSISSLTRDDI